MILKEKKIVFVHVPRTSGTSIEKAMINGKVPDDVKHLSARDIKEILGSQWDDYFKFTIVRNPWDRIVSLYHQPYFKKIGAASSKGMRFFLENYKPAPWEHGMQCSDFANEAMDLVIKFEERDVGLKKLMVMLNFYFDENIHERKTNRKLKDYRPYFDDEAKRMVQKMYSDDIEKYDYKFE